MQKNNAYNATSSDRNDCTHVEGRRERDGQRSLWLYIHYYFFFFSFLNKTSISTERLTHEEINAKWNEEEKEEKKNDNSYHCYR